MRGNAVGLGVIWLLAPACADRSTHVSGVDAGGVEVGAAAESANDLSSASRDTSENSIIDARSASDLPRSPDTNMAGIDVRLAGDVSSTSPAICATATGVSREIVGHLTGELVGPAINRVIVTPVGIFTTRGDGIYAIPTDGSPLRPIYTSDRFAGQVGYSIFLATDRHIFFGRLPINEPPRPEIPLDLLRVGVDGAAPLLLESVPQSRSFPRRQPVLADGERLYWNVGVGDSKGAIERTDLDGASRTTVVSIDGSAYSFLHDERAIYWLETPPPSPDQSAEKREDVRLRLLIKSDGTSDTLVERLPLGTMQQFEDTLYFVPIFACSRFFVIPKRGGRVTALASTMRHPLAFAVDRTNLFWGARTKDAYDIAEGGVFKTSLDGATTTELVAAGTFETSGPYGPQLVGVDDRYVYWKRSYQLYRAPKP